MPFFLVERDECGRYAGLSSDSGHWQNNHTVYNNETGEIAELNHYDNDSEFYLSSLTDRKQKSVKVTYAEMLAMSVVPPEVMEAYNTKKARIAAEAEAKRRQNYIDDQNAKAAALMKMLTEDAVALMLVDTEAVAKMHQAHGEKIYKECVKICKSYLSGKLRSSFRKSLAEQIIEWCHDTEKQTKYAFPLSRRQTDALMTQITQYTYR